MRGLEAIFVLGLIAGSCAIPTYSNSTATDDCSLNDTIKSFPHPTNCSKYFQCENGTKVEMNCSYNLHYNNVLRVCDFPRYAGCKINESSTTLAPTTIALKTFESKNDNNSSINKEQPKSKNEKVPVYNNTFQEKSYKYNNTIGTNDTGISKNESTTTTANNPYLSKNKNSTFIRILTNSTFNTTDPANNSNIVTKENVRATTEKIPLIRNRNNSSLEPSGVTNRPSNVSPLTSPKIPGDSTESVTEDNTETEETNDKDDEKETDEEEKNENEKPSSVKKE